MCGRSDALSSAIQSAIAEEAGAAKPSANGASPRRRISLWEQTDNVHCSLLGTCASVDDIRKVARRVGIKIAPETPDYDIHGHFVRESTQDTPFTRAFQKLLDHRFAGALRRVARARDDAALQELWDDMCGCGHVAAAYWAFMTQGHVPTTIRARIFGEVHMWSHLAGASYRQKTGEVAALRTRMSEFEERSKRIEVGLRDALDARDRDIAALKDEIAGLRARPSVAPAPAARVTRTLERRLDKANRAVAVARERARAAEARVVDLTQQLEHARAPETALERLPASASAPSTASADDEAILINRSTTPRTILYVGGLQGQRERLRDIAARYNADFLHHDGGLEDAPQRLDKLLPSVDCVFCPVNCVSHDACLRAKKVCQKLNKPFVALRSSGQGAFHRALRDLATGVAPPQISGQDRPQPSGSTDVSKESACTSP